MNEMKKLETLRRIQLALNHEAYVMPSIVGISEADAYAMHVDGLIEIGSNQFAPEGEQIVITAIRAAGLLALDSYARKSERSTVRASTLGKMLWDVIKIIIAGVIGYLLGKNQ